MLTRLKERFDSEPVVVLGAVRAIIYAATLFGLNLTNEQFMALIVVAESVSAIFTRGKVTPTATVSTSGMPARFVGAVLLAVALGAGAGCAGKNIAPELVATEDAVHDALAAAQDSIDKVCQPASVAALRATCAETNAVLAQALRAGRAYSEAVFNERIGGLGKLVEEVGRLVTAVRQFPAGELRERVLADLRRTIDAAFKGAQ